jgi:hypothetical protein
VLSTASLLLFKVNPCESFTLKKIASPTRAYKKLDFAVFIPGKQYKPGTNRD